MDLTKILAVSGRPGLYRLVSQASRGIIAEAITDGKKVTIFSTERISTLGEISIFTVENDVPLKEVFRTIFEKLEGKPAISHKSSANELRKFMEEMLPNYDEDRVYNSDIQKLINWYNLLVDKGLIDLEPDAEEESAKEEVAEEGEKEVKKEPKKEVKAEKKPKPEGKPTPAAKKQAAPAAAKPTQRKTSPRAK